jgi:hypothetical protein
MEALSDQSQAEWGVAESYEQFVWVETDTRVGHWNECKCPVMLLRTHGCGSRCRLMKLNWS